MDDYTGAPPKGWPRFPNDVITQSIPDYAAIVERLDKIAEALRQEPTNLVTFELKYGNKRIAINPVAVQAVTPHNNEPEYCYIMMRTQDSEGAETYSVKGDFDEVLAKLGCAQ